MDNILYKSKIEENLTNLHYAVISGDSEELEKFKANNEIDWKVLDSKGRNLWHYAMLNMQKNSMTILTDVFTAGYKQLDYMPSH